MRNYKVHTPHEIERYKKQFAILKSRGMLQRDIAKALGVSITTISKWANDLPMGLYFTIRKGMQKRLIALNEDKGTPAMDIYNLANALSGIEKTISKLSKDE
ncbi:helix-turn-helix domain-containing protein [Flavitalea flava]